MYIVDDAERFSRALKSTHKVASRVEVFRGHDRLSYDAPWLSGTVTDTWTIAGVRRTFSLEVPPTPTWLEWLSTPLVVRPYRGIRYARNQVVECPLGVFPVLMPERDYTRTARIKINADDLYQRVGRAKFSAPYQTSELPLAEQIDALLQGAGLDPAVILIGASVTRAAQTFEDSRADAIGELAKAGPFEVYIDRDGRTTINRHRALEATPTAYLIVGQHIIESIRLKPDWDKVFNQVSIKSTKQDVEFDPVVLSITDRNHPAHPSKMFGYNVKVYSSNAIENRDQAVAIAEAMLPKVSGAANTYTYTCVPDPRLDAGDTITASALDGSFQFCQIDSVTTPLDAGGRQTITTVSTQLEYEP